MTAPSSGDAAALEAAWRDLIDADVPAATSVLRRYRRVFGVVDPALRIDDAILDTCSLGEGAILRRLGSYGGVEIIVCDETQQMRTGTYKALDACVTAAALRGAGIRRVVASSGGNLSAALGAYLQHAGIEALLFQPSTTLFKQDRRFFGGSTRLISVDLPEPQVKSLAAAVAERYAITPIPDTRWRLAASAARAMFVAEAIRGALGPIDFLTQTVCAGFGPTGIYSCLRLLRRRGLLRASAIPRLMGFQQEANSPIVRAWRAGAHELSAEHIAPAPERYIEPGLYNTNPGPHYARLAALMRTFGGAMMAIGEAEYRDYAELVRADLEAAGVRMSTLPGSDDLLEKTGLLTGVGIYRAIDAGILQPGELFLYMLTGGHRELDAAATPEPDLVVDDSQSEAAWTELIGERYGLDRAAE
ncbi:MAG: pyridoxal-phosphate dependent enzyme [Myxococcales bacterium]|nr:pyridoxal-phosphate dependent enzyme [Myxococcales bacterium]